MKILKVITIYCVSLFMIIWYCNFPSNILQTLITTIILSFNMLFPILLAFFFNWLGMSKNVNDALGGNLKYCIYIYVIGLIVVDIIMTYNLIISHNIGYIFMYLPTIVAFYSCRYFCEKLERDSYNF